MEIKHENTALALEIAGCVAVDVLHCLKRDAVSLIAKGWRGAAGWLDAELPFCLKRERDVLAADLARMTGVRDDLRRELMDTVETISALRTRETNLVEQIAALTASVEAGRSSALRIAGERDLWKAKAEEAAARLVAPPGSNADAGIATAEPSSSNAPEKPARTKRKASSRKTSKKA